MFKFRSREIDYIEVLPPASVALKANLEQLIDDSSNLNAALESLDKQTGTYRIVLQGTLPNQDSGL